MSKLERYRMINILSMILVCILVIIIYLPQKRGINLRTKEIAGLKAVVSRLIEIDSNPSEFTERKDKIIGDLSVINDKIPPESIISQVIEYVTKPIKELGLSLIAITPGEPVERGGKVETSGEIPGIGTQEVMPEEEEGYMETPIELTLQGTYTQFGEYLDELRHLPRLVVIDSFDIRKNNEISSKLDIRLKIAVFHYGKD